ncbi:MAG: tripartite tricarboxylate transporter substrate binding protein [Spirochaetaceae bacterium]|nr:tripartite tricarboxylate transporter substrate binding protein [Spirochaetaceae bacterium]MCF7947598.1 tripartite tricarboxylate transporter substrate binding protein [Spirochaetia bacterium]MCF7951466.1 tripartite tricarboxylate transporter substrate binding protein [Spirochaetaceae bacterium]
MKKIMLVLMLVLAVTAYVSAEGQQESDGSWSPSKTVTWYCTSSPGGGSSIFTQTIIEIINDENLVEEDIIINYKTDGGGAVGRREVSRAKTNGHTLLTFNNGDLQPLVQVENGELDDLTPIAVMANDGQILLVRSNYKYQTGEELVEAMESGERIIFGGSKGDDINFYNKIDEEVGGDTEYLVNDSTGDALTQILGEDIDVVIAKPAASYELVSSGELVPVIAATKDRFDEPFDAPTFKELGYDIELTVFRGVAAPKNMPQAAVDFWSDVMGKVSETDAWQNNYLDKFLLTGRYIPADEAYDYMKDFEEKYKANM